MDFVYLIFAAVVLGFTLGAVLLARWRAPERQLATFLVGLVVFSGCAIWGLSGLVIAALDCDESCDEDSSDWTNVEAAWQWDAIGWLTATGVICLIAAIYLYAARGAWQWFVGAALVAAALFTALVAQI